VTVALIVADGDVPERAAVERLLAGEQPIVVAADGGALKAEAIGYPPEVVVGDVDSLDPGQVERLRRAGVAVIVHPAAKDESDTELAVAEALGRGATRLVVVGAFGGRRLEHTVANVLLLASERLRGRDICLADGASTLRVVHAGERLEVRGRLRDYVSLLPLTERVGGVTTSGLAYPLSDAVLEQGPARGLSNQLSSTSAAVSIESGRLAVVHTLANEVHQP
jgi:thiamine pyrophosphokinase